MNCPIDNTPLQMTERQGVEIDYCPQCRGVWLDRGELDKIIDKSSQVETQSTHSNSGHKRYYDHNDDHYSHSHHKKKREGFLSDLFDF